ncbi:hypothetical protein [Pseudoxanthomonas putridarboris]|uniref:hypothetical protein n=1 Tax=Pseudoxanthomonas putridarboris TaxID=752605 RepID=UPI00311DA74A
MAWIEGLVPGSTRQGQCAWQGHLPKSRAKSRKALCRKAFAVNERIHSVQLPGKAGKNLPAF